MVGAGASGEMHCTSQLVTSLKKYRSKHSGTRKRGREGKEQTGSTGGISKGQGTINNRPSDLKRFLRNQILPGLLTDGELSPAIPSGPACLSLYWWKPLCSGFTPLPELTSPPTVCDSGGHCPATGEAGRPQRRSTHRAALSHGEGQAAGASLGTTTRSQEYCQEAVASSKWLVTTKKCHSAGVMVRRPLYFIYVQDTWARNFVSQ